MCKAAQVNMSPINKLVLAIAKHQTKNMTGIYKFNLKIFELKSFSGTKYNSEQVFGPVLPIFLCKKAN